MCICVLNFSFSTGRILRAFPYSHALRSVDMRGVSRAFLICQKRSHNKTIQTVTVIHQTGQQHLTLKPEEKIKKLHFH